MSHRHKVKEKRKLFGFLDVKIVSPISTFVLNTLTLKWSTVFFAVPKFVNFMSASCFPECKDLQSETFCRHYKTYCKSMVNIRKACKKTCGLCKYIYCRSPFYYMYFSSNEEEPAACLPVIKNNLTTTKSESEFFWFALIKCICNVTVAPNRHIELIRSNGKFPIRIARVLFVKFQVNYLVLRRP